VRARIHHNLIHDVMLRCFDSAAIDSLGTNHQYVRIDHNLIYNLQGERKYGIYFDFASHGIVDHNVVYNVTRPVQHQLEPGHRPPEHVAAEQRRHLRLASRGGAGYREQIQRRQHYPQQHLVQWHLGRRVEWRANHAACQGDNQQQHPASSALFVDAVNANMAARNYQLKSTASTAINQGVSVAPYDDKLVGLPDIGAYEYGVAPWPVGARQVTSP
jgi:hypothetical protein